MPNKRATGKPQQPDPSSRTYGNRLRAVRKDRGLRQVDVAVGLGMSPGGYSSVERGVARMFIADIDRYAEALGVSPAYLSRRLGLCSQAEDLTDALIDRHGPVLGSLLARVDKAAHAWEQEQRTTFTLVTEGLLDRDPQVPQSPRRAAEPTTAEA